MKHKSAGRGRQIWREASYEDFADGQFGNGGQNLYCSRKGVLQRIFHFDVNADGYTDLLFVNAQDMNERVDLDLHENPFGQGTVRQIPAPGAFAGATGDFNGDGYDDLLIANQHNGVHGDLCSYVYFGGPDGLSESRRIELHAPNARAAAIGDFFGTGKPAVALATENRLRIYPQYEQGLDATRRTDFNLAVTHMVAADLDGDGYADLYVRVRGEAPRVLWGGPDGLDPERFTLVGHHDPSAKDIQTTTAWRLKIQADWTPRVVRLNNRTYLYRAEENRACLYPVEEKRHWGEPLRLDCPHSVAAFGADFDGDGHDDLLLLVAQNFDKKEHLAENSWILWGGPQEWSMEQATAISTINARDAAIADFDGDGKLEIVLAQGATEKMLTTESLRLRVRSRDKIERETFVTHDAVAVFALHAPDSRPRLAVLNHEGGRVRGDVDAFLYWGGPDGYRPDRRLALPTRSAPDGVCCDFNDDGRTDIAIFNCAENAPHEDPGTFIYWQGPEGFNTRQPQILPTFHAHGSAVGDFRHSGYLDIAVGGFSNPELRIFRGGPDGYDPKRFDRIWLDPDIEPYEPGITIDPAENERGVHYNQVRWMLAGDFNHDGWLDLFVSEILGRHSFILWGGPDGFSTKRMQRLYVDGISTANAADLTGNGWLDLVLGAHNTRNSRAFEYESNVYIYWGGPEGYSEFRRMQLPVTTCNSLAIADFNNDGQLDIFAGCYHGGRHRDIDSFLFWNRAGRGFSMTDRQALPSHSACGCIAADFNEDGYVDLAVACHKTRGNHDSQSQVWWNGPKGFDPQHITELPTAGPHGMIVVDPGNILTRGEEEYYISSPHPLPPDARITAIRWEAEYRPKTWVHAQLRFAASAEALAHAPWQGPTGEATWFDKSGTACDLHPSAGWMQYRLALGATNGGNTARVSAVEVEYES